MAPPKLKTLTPFLLLLLLLALFLLSCTTLAHAREDPELQQCKEECWRQPHYDYGMRRRCEQRCEEKQRERESERERERGREVFFANPREVPAERRLEQCRRQCEEAGGRRGEQQRHQCEQRCWERYREERQQEQQDAGVSDQDPQEKLQQCRRWCEERHQGDRRERRRCEEQCDEKYSEERGRGRGNPRREEEKEEEEEEEERGGENPYVFEPQSFKHRLRSEHGHFKVLKKFHKQSNLLIGIANYRLAILELNPQTFAMPNHWDADDICYVIKGENSLFIFYALN